MSLYSEVGNARVWRWGGIGAVAAIVFFGGVGTSRAEDDGAGKVVAVEEDWELVVKQPDEETQGPQVTCIIAPNDQVYAAFNLNHKSFPQYDAGGLHLQLWESEVPLQSAQFSSDALLATQDETISWTTRMFFEDGQLVFEVVDGSSTTWGSFGGDGELRVATNGEAANLNQYTASDSIANSGIGFAGNRVTSLKLKAVRRVLKSGDVIEDSEVQIVYPQE